MFSIRPQNLLKNFGFSDAQGIRQGFCLIGPGPNAALKETDPMLRDATPGCKFSLS